MPDPARLLRGGNHPLVSGASVSPGSPPGKPCLRCLLRDLPEGAALSAALQELISQIPPEDRASEAQVRQRLEACRGCGHLHRGTCGLCGCYVEHRAEKKGASCPSLPSRWS